MVTSTLSVRVSPFPCKNGIVRRTGKSTIQMLLRGASYDRGRSSLTAHDWLSCKWIWFTDFFAYFVAGGFRRAGFRSFLESHFTPRTTCNSPNINQCTARQPPSVYRQSPLVVSFALNGSMR